GQFTPLPWPPADSVGGTRVLRIGREPDNDVVLDYPMISRYHARIIVTASGAAMLQDLGSTNGTALGSPERRITRSPLSRNDTVYFGSFHLPAARLLPGQVTPGPVLPSTIAFDGQTMTLGRDMHCDQVLDYPMVSRQHARLRRTGDSI